MTRFRSVAEVIEDPCIQGMLMDMLLDLEEYEPFRGLMRLDEDMAREEAERRWLESLRFPPKAVARAANVRLGIVRKYVRAGVRYGGRLSTDDEGNVSLWHLERFASRHKGRARDIALKAKDRLSAESILALRSPIGDRRTRNHELRVFGERVYVKSN